MHFSEQPTLNCQLYFIKFVSPTTNAYYLTGYFIFAFINANVNCAAISICKCRNLFFKFFLLLRRYFPIGKRKFLKLYFIAF